MPPLLPLAERMSPPPGKVKVVAARIMGVVERPLFKLNALTTSRVTEAV